MSHYESFTKSQQYAERHEEIQTSETHTNTFSTSQMCVEEQGDPH